MASGLRQPWGFWPEFPEQLWSGLDRVHCGSLCPQYPVRPASMTYDDIPHLSAKIKPKQQKVGLRFVPGWGAGGGPWDWKPREAAGGECRTARASGPEGGQLPGGGRAAAVGRPEDQEEQGLAGPRSQGAAGALVPIGWGDGRSPKATATWRSCPVLPVPLTFQEEVEIGVLWEILILSPDVDLWEWVGWVGGQTYPQDSLPIPESLLWPLL